MSSETGAEKVARFDGLKWLGVFLIGSVAVYGNAHFSEVPILYRVLVLLLFAVAGLFLCLQTEKGRTFWALLRDAKAEVRRVVWPTRQETTQTTLVVLTVVLLMSLVLWGLDSLLGWLINSLIG